MSLSCLPDEVLKLVMQHVPLSDRLTSCCFVNMRLHAAAVAATASGTVLFEGEGTSSLLAWLPQYGHNVMHLGLSDFSQPLQQLPCPNLQELQLKCCIVQLGPTADGQPGVVHDCTKLTRLELQCHIMDGPMIDSLSQLVHLQHLHVQPRGPGPAYECCAIGSLSSATLTCLRQLTCLEAHGLAVESLAQLSALTCLQALHCELSGPPGVVAMRPSTSLVFPVSLKTLDVRCDVEVGVLCLIPAGLTALMLFCVVPGPTEGADMLLSHLAKG
jgi:hypothetical protein